MKNLTIGYNNAAIYFCVNGSPVTLKAFLSSPEKYQESEYLEKEFKNYMYNPNSKFRKSLPFNRIVDLNMRLKGKSFISCLEILQNDFGLKISKNGLPFIDTPNIMRAGL